MKINEVFESIQGEGKYVSHPVLFVRMAKCNLTCNFCDTEFNSYKDMTVDELSNEISQSKLETIVWTGGEPTLQMKDILKVMTQTRKRNHIETNGFNLEGLNKFHYIAFSPKNLNDAEKVADYKTKHPELDIDIKVPTNLSINKELIPYATMLMPLQSGQTTIDKHISQQVWSYCVKNNLKYSPRTHVDVWGFKSRRI